MKRDIKELISNLTLEEKASLCSGQSFWYTKEIDRLGIPSVMLSDGPHGLRKQEGSESALGKGECILSVCFPAACATSSSFDEALIEDMGRTLGEECQAKDISVLLGPAMNIKRSPLCGRNFEYFSEDPFLSGKIAAAHVRGVQSWGVGTSLKHFACNNQEYFRMSVSSEVDERTLREIYLLGFEIAVKEAEPKTIMCSYNKINGVFSAENKKLLTDILRGDWGFKGYVMTDWGAVSDRVKGIEAGLDLEMPSSNGINDKKIVEAVKAGLLDECLLDKAVENMLNVTFDYVDNRRRDAVFDLERDSKKACDIESQCAVLLKNDGVLPLDPKANVAYIGEFASHPRYQGGGSSHVNSSKVISALDAGKKKGRSIVYAKGFPFDRDEIDEEEIEKAVSIAKNASVAVVFAGLPDSFESEGFDRKDMKLPEGQNCLIEKLIAAGIKVIVVLHNGAPVELPWADKVSSILEMYLGGQEVGEACDRLLFGEENPSGHLSETFPFRLEDTPSYLTFPGDGKKVKYTEGIFVGYRYYQAKNIPVRFPFGHGLSYTTFEYSSLSFSSSLMKDEDEILVSVKVKNTGDRSGREVVQLYVSDKTGTIGRPIRELKDFKKIFLEPKEEKKVELKINAKSLSYFSEELGDWFAKSGEYEILIGRSCEDIRLSGKIMFETKKHLPLEIKPDTTIISLLEDSRCEPIIKQYIEKYSPWNDVGEVEGMGAGGNEMAHAMITGLPLKSLGSFGMGDSFSINKLIQDLKKAISEKLS